MKVKPISKSFSNWLIQNDDPFLHIVGLHGQVIDTGVIELMKPTFTLVVVEDQSDEDEPYTYLLGGNEADAKNFLTQELLDTRGLVWNF